MSTSSVASCPPTTASGVPRPSSSSRLGAARGATNGEKAAGSVRLVAGPRGARPRRSWPQRLLIAFNLSFIAGTLVAAGGLGYLNWKLDQLPRIELGDDVLEEVEAPGEPQNYLIVGTDSAAGLSEDDPVTIGRENLGVLSDTIMVLRVDPDAEE